MKAKENIYAIICMILIGVTSCKKFLDVKPSNSYSTVSSISDAQAVIDNIYINQFIPFYGEWSADNYYYQQSSYDAYILDNSAAGNLYLWKKFPFTGLTSTQSCWAQAYSSIMYANTSLDALNKIVLNSQNRTAGNNAKGCALAIRGYYFWKLATTFAKGYNDASATTDLGIPIRVDISVEKKATRSNLKDTYDQIINDLSNSLNLLPIKPTSINRPSKSSVYAMLSEVYISMRNYEKAKLYADSSLTISHDLIDFNSLDKLSPTPPVDGNNKEVLISLGSGGGPTGFGNGAIDSTLFASYDANDLRRRSFFSDAGDGTYFMLGTYCSNYNFYCAPAVDEMYLSRAECNARAGNTGDAMKDLNTLMKNRIDKDYFVPYTASSAQEALRIILQERRKELVFRDLRWMDIKRLNLEGANIILTRRISGKTYTLEPNSPRYAIQLPADVIQLSGMEQNPY